MGDNRSFVLFLNKYAHIREYRVAIYLLERHVATGHNKVLMVQIRLVK